MEKKIKVGVIGVGSIAEMHIAGYKADPRVELAAFCDINEERLKEKGERHGVTRLYTDVKDMVAKEELDAVSVCTWNAAHAPCTIAALEAGLHVLCEKPMAMNVAEAEAMRDAAKRSGKLRFAGSATTARWCRISSMRGILAICITPRPPICAATAARAAGLGINPVPAAALSLTWGCMSLTWCGI